MHLDDFPARLVEAAERLFFQGYFLCNILSRNSEVEKLDDADMLAAIMIEAGKKDNALRRFTSRSLHWLKGLEIRKFLHLL